MELAEGGGDYEDTGIPIYSWGGGGYSTEQAYTGTHSWKWTAGGNWNGPFLRQAATSPMWPGCRIDLRAKIKPHASNSTASGYVLIAARFWLDAAHTSYVDSTWVTISNSALSAGWNTLESLGIVAPAGTMSVEMWVLSSSDTPASNMYYVDAVSVRIPPLVLSDGTLTATAVAVPQVTANFGGGGTLSATAGFPSHAAARTNYTSAGAATYTIPWWANKVDVVIIGGGGGGNKGGAFNTGPGGTAAVWSTITITRGSDIPWTTASMSVTVGSGGTGGSTGGAGGNSVVSATGMTTRTANGGAGGTAACGWPGCGASNVTYNSQTYTGGAGGGGGGGTGTAPGGAGGGGNLFNGGGGNGAQGQVSFYAYQ